METIRNNVEFLNLMRDLENNLTLRRQRLLAL